MLEAIFWGGILRFVQALLQAAPTILIGILVAGVFRRLMGYVSVRKLFGHGTKRALVQAWAVGMLLPVCSLGVIPVIREMKKAGLSGGTILAFALSAPLFNPLSVLYGLTLADPTTILSFAFCSLIVVSLVGAGFDWLFPDNPEPSEGPPKVPHGFRRMLAVGAYSAREASGSLVFLIALGLGGVVFLNAIFPPGFLQGAVNGDNPMAPLIMTGVAIPAYVTPMLAMSQLGMMFAHANSVGAAFTLLVLGAGFNLGLGLWMIMNYGVRKSAAWIGLLLVVVLGLSYSVEKPLYPTHVQPADHTHAFDIYCRPFADNTTQMPTLVYDKIEKNLQIHELYSLYGFLALIMIGVALRSFDPKQKTESWLERPAKTSGRTFDVTLPGPVVGLSVLAIIVGLSVVGCYLYYPDPEFALDEINFVKTDALAAAMTGEKEEAMHWIPIMDDWTRKLEVGTFLRHGQVSEYHHAKAEIIREKLELLEHAVAQNETEEVREMVASIQRSTTRLSRAYREEL